MTSASVSLAVQMPTAPRAICRWAIAGHLWVLVCGRTPMPLLDTVDCMVSMLCSSRSKSTQSAGVRRSDFDRPTSR